MDKIWWQTFSSAEWAGPYWDYLRQHAEAVLDGTAEFHLSGLPSSTFGPYPPMDILGYPLASQVLMQEIPPLALEAEDKGYDAFIIASYTEPHLKVLRSAVDIPVISTVESTLFAACSNAAKIGIVVITPELRQAVAEVVARHGLTSRVAHIAVMEPNVLEHELAAPAFADPSDMTTRFERAAAECVAATADVVIPGEGILSEVLHSAGMHTAAGAPVVDCFGVTLLYAQFQIAAARRAHLAQGRTWSYPKLPADKDAFIRAKLIRPAASA